MENKEDIIFEYDEKYRHPILLALNLTNDCNLACRYCFVEQKPEYMSLDIAIQSVEYVIENYQLHKNIYKDIDENRPATIWFFGGEPLLCFNTLIKPTMEYCEKQGYLKDIGFSLTTNVTLLDKEKIQFLHKYNTGIMLSIDGAPETQNYNRPCKNSNLKSSELIEKNIPDILQEIPNIIFRSTIYKPTILNIFENYLYAESLGFQYINFTPDTRALDWTTEDYQNIENEFLKIFAYRLYQYRNNISPMQFENLDVIYRNILSHDLYFTNLQLGNIENLEQIEPIDPLVNCGLGTRSAAIDFQGNIYSCQERPSKQKKDIFLLGNINTGIDPQKHEQLLKQFIKEVNTYGFQNSNPTLCDNCLTKINCIKSCISSSKDLFNNYITINENRCKFLHILTKLALNSMDILVKEKNKIFYADLLKYTNEYRIFSNLVQENFFDI